MPQPVPLPIPSRAVDFIDGSLYEFPNAVEWRSTIYSRVALVDQTVIKLASDYGDSEYKRFVVYEERDNDAIRSNELIEKLANLSALIDRYPVFRKCVNTYGDKKIHWLLIHKLQFDRLRQIAPRAIPDARFVLLTRKRFLLSPSIRPALVQERVSGISLRDTIDHDAITEDATRSFVKSEFRGYLHDIAAQLAPFMQHNAADHINWNIRNFIFDSTRRMLFYIDMKPSNIFGRWRNEQSLQNIRRDFMGQP